jgi:hypothetical protein
MQALSFPFSAHPKVLVLSVERMASKSLFGTARSSPKPPKAGAQSARLELAGPNKHTVQPVSILCQAPVHSVSRCRVHGSLRSPMGSTAAFMRQKVGAAMSRARSAFLQPQEEWRGRRHGAVRFELLNRPNDADRRRNHKNIFAVIFPLKSKA